MNRKPKDLTSDLIRNKDHEKITWDLILMGKCDECWALVTDEGISPGMTVEIERAKKRRQKVRYFNERYEEVQL